MLSRLFKLYCLILITILTSACAGTRPSHLGKINTDLPPCPDKPNCVSSQAQPDDETHFIQPLSVSNEKVAREQLTSLLQQWPEADLQVNSPTYMYAEFTSDWLGFVDDVEFLFGENDGIIHLRSASRLGYADFDVNRKRIERIRAALQNK
ncbi:MAG: DUF1499 domain-containing protein [Oleiphilaceae bacterium]|nr:DUF1499 domain-containing protein [Oleiphilaceae bacterium]